jgi:hypothetical protein
MEIAWEGEGFEIVYQESSRGGRLVSKEEARARNHWGSEHQPAFSLGRQESVKNEFGLGIHVKQGSTPCRFSTQFTRSRLASKLIVILSYEVSKG